MEKLKHASVGDWDFSSIAWTLDTTTYVSPPSSLKNTTLVAAGVIAICKNPVALLLPQGKIQSYFRIPYSTCSVAFFFRNTANPGSASYDNCYRLYTRPTDIKWQLNEFLNGTQPRGWLIDRDPIPLDEWRSYRVTWWNSWGLLMVRVEHLIDGTWTQQGDDVAITDPLHGDAPYQRPGIMINRLPTAGPVWADDTQIFCPIP